MEIKFSKPLPIGELKAKDDEWSVEGYPSTFGNLDLGDDVVEPGAFAETLKDGPKVRFLLSHDPRLILGVPKMMKEDNKGLFGNFKISKTQLGTDTYQLLKDKALDSFSIGYEAVDWEITEGDIRHLKKVTLYEVSLVPMPMNTEAIVTGVKDWSYLLQQLTLAERTNRMSEELKQLLNDLRGLVDGIDRPLSETKRQELTELLESCSGWDAVRSDLQSVLQTAPQPRLVASRQAKYELAEARRRLLQKGVLS